MTVGGAPLDPARRYTAAVIDYIAAGKDGLTALRAGRVLVDAMNAPLLADILLQAVTTQTKIAPQPDGRIRTLHR
jgi:2',3'-cyclic-nucleotide 2'-phosphodiesterase (5'-nucleotidase family)